MTELIYLTAAEISGMIMRGEVSCLEVVKAHLERIEQFNPELNAFVTIDSKGAIQKANDLDEDLKMGKIRGVLHGVPFAVKDFFETEGIPTKCGCRELANNIPSKDADAVARLKAAGAVILGKTALSMFGGTVDSYDENIGNPNNPWDVRCTTGGSSGGSAASVASGMSTFDLGADMGGSIRMPAHFCGLWGLKPTGGSISTNGVRASLRSIKIPPKWDFFDQVVSAGPIARSAGDLRLLYNVLANEINAEKSEHHEKKLEEMKFVFSRTLGGVSVSIETQVQFDKFLKKLEGAGARLEEISQEQLNAIDIEEAQESASALLMGFLSYSVDAFTLFARMLGCYVFPIPKGEGQAVMRGVLRGTTRSRNAEGFHGLIEMRQKFIRSMDKFLSGYDAWLLPAFPVHAFKHKDRIKHGVLDDPFNAKIDVDGKEFGWLMAAFAYNLIFNFSGHPAACVPAMSSSKGMPMGVQVVGSRGEDIKLLLACEEIEKVTGSFRRPPGY